MLTAAVLSLCPSPSLRPQVDALRFLLDTEVTEVYAAGSGGSAVSGGADKGGSTGAAINACEVLSLT